MTNKQNKSVPIMANNHNNQQRRKQTVSIFESPIVLKPFDKYSFPASSVQLLENKNAEFQAEFKAFLKTQSQIFDLKLEHIEIEHNTSKHYEEAHNKLAASMQQKINQKRNELTGKWDEFVKDQKEIQILKQKISQKHLDQFKEQVHFENTSEFNEIMKSKKLTVNEKELFRSQLKEFRDKMITEYDNFRQQHYGTYDQKLKEIQIREQQQSKQ